jgi:hypothetical protein
MVDLETLGTAPGSLILSIGAVKFDPAKPSSECLGEEFYCVVSQSSCLQVELTIDPATEEWWKRQSIAARQVLTDSEDEAVAISLFDALLKLANFISPNDRVWSNGANFDQPLLDVAYDRCGIKLPWAYWNSRCYRTIVALHSGEKGLRPPKTCAHNALEDAKWQAKHMTNIAERLGLALKL